MTFFEDTNSNGTKDGGEQTITDVAATPKIEVYNAQGEKENIDKTVEKTATGYVIKGLVTAQNYTVKLISTDPNKRFTTGTGNENRSSTTEPLIPTLTSVADTALKPVGLTTRITLVQPSLTPVDDTSAVNGQEKTEVETAVRAANPVLPAGTTVTVAANGDATVTFPDGYSQVLTNIVSQRPTTAVPTVDKVDTDDTKVTGTGVAGATIEVTLPDGSKKTTTVGQDGKWEVALDAPLAKDAVVKATQKEADKKPSGEATTTVVPTTADLVTPALPENKVKVDNPAQLTDEEKAKVAEEVKKANPTFPAGTTVEVANNGDVKITYPDKSVDTISGQNVVELKPEKAKVEELPNTGTSSEYLLFGAAATSILLGLGLVKRDDDEEATN